MLGFKQVKDDPLYNRRRFMVISFCYAVLWGFVILICDIIRGFDVSKVVAYLGFISTLSGAGLFAYFKQAAKDTPDARSDDNPKS
jgi:hypothetical protein